VSVHEDLELIRSVLHAGVVESLASEKQRTAFFELRVYPDEWPRERCEEYSEEIHELADNIRAWEATCRRAKNIAE